MNYRKLIVTIVLLFCSVLSAQAQFQVIESSIQQGSTEVAVSDTLFLKFNAPINSDTLVSRNPKFTFGKISSFPIDSILAGNVTVVDDSTLAVPYEIRPNKRISLYVFETYSSDGTVMDPYSLSFSTGPVLSESTISGTLTFPEGHDEGAIVALIPRNDYTQFMITQPLAFSVAATYVPNGETDYVLENVPSGNYFVYAFGSQRPSSESALLSGKPIGSYDTDDDGISDAVSVGAFNAEITDIDIELAPIQFTPSGTDAYRDEITDIAETRDESSQLIHVSSLTPTNTAGEADLWLWLYYSTERDKAFGYVTSGEQLILGFPTLLDLSFFKAIDSAWVNSDVAVENAIEEASEFLAGVSDTLIFADLSGGLQADFLYEDSAWRIVFLADSAREVVYLDATTGEVIELESISARTAYDVLLDTVTSLAPDAYLTTALTSFQGASGLAPVWIMEFYSAQEDRFYTASTSALENPFVVDRENIRGRVPFELDENWIDSDALMDSLSLIDRYPGDEEIKRVELFLAPINTEFPSDTITTWQVFASTNNADARPFIALIVAETGLEFMFPEGTAFDWLESAETAAEDWAVDAELVRVNSFGGRTVNEEGESEIWRYVFKSETLTDSVLHVYSTDNDTRSFSIPVDDSVLVNIPTISNTDSLIDSDQAMAIAFSEDSIATEPNLEFDFVGARMALDVIRVNRDSTLTVWSVYNPFRTIDRIGFQRIVINAESGEILRERIRTTDRTPFEVAQTTAHDWQEDARLHWVSADSVNEDGTVEVWRFIFWSRAATDAYEIIVQGGTEIISEMVIEDLPERFDRDRPIKRWLESARAMVIANEFIGDALRLSGALSNVRIELYSPDNGNAKLNPDAEEEGTWIVYFEQNDGSIETVEVSFSGEIATSNEDVLDVPVEFELSQNYPNPFNPSTNIQFSLPQAARVQLDVFNILGQRVATLVNNEQRQAGVHSVSFDASRLASGMYIYRIQAGSNIQTRKMMLIK